METKELDRPAFWGETLLALGPFLLLTVLFLLVLLLTPFISNLNDPTIGLVIQLGVVLILLVVLLAGWVKNFPRWVFPYWGFALTITLYFFHFTGTVSGYPFRGNWRVWIPLGGVALVGLLWTRSFRPIYNLFESLWKDWTLLSFAFYGALPLFFFAAYDEVHDAKFILTMFILILGAGAAFYMRTESIWHRFASLVGGFSIGWLVLMIHLGLYWTGRQESGMGAPGTWAGTLDWTSRFGLILMLALVAPVLLGFLHWAVKSLSDRSR
jgi:hypothetical protein